MLTDIEVYVKIDLNKNRDFWSDIVTIVQDELGKLRKMERTQYEEAADRRQGINSAGNSHAHSFISNAILEPGDTRWCHFCSGVLSPGG